MASSAKWKTIGDLKRSRLLSGNIIDVLDGLTPSRHLMTPTADVSSYLENVLRRGRRAAKTTDGFVYHTLSGLTPGVDLESVVRPIAPVGDKLRLSPGLIAVFEDAFAIRRQTGGKDRYIGERHVIAAIATETTEDIATELR